jgi:hypothetical protein
MTRFSKHESARLVEVLCDPSMSSVARDFLLNNEGDNEQNRNLSQVRITIERAFVILVRRLWPHSTTIHAGTR